MTISYFCIRMKNILPLLVFATTCTLAACTGENKETPDHNATETMEALPAGTIIAADSMPVKEEQLNNFVFSAKVTTTPKTAKGNYMVDAAWGYNTAQSEIIMPKNDYPLIPVLQRTAEPYTYIIGFYIKGDTTFYDYYKISAQRGSITMGYTKGYRFQ